VQKINPHYKGIPQRGYHIPISFSTGSSFSRRDRILNSVVVSQVLPGAGTKG
jgi:hypothetical protein